MSQSPTSALVPIHHARALGDYVILAELARGGMGRVYLARRSGQAGFARLFAIKVMHHHGEDDRDALLMLLDEAHIASRLHHPNVVSVLDIGTSDGGYYLVMDYVEGCSLHELLKRHRGPRPVRLVVPIVLEALHGLHAVHCLADGEGRPYGVVHRDVSPHNLLVGVDGGCRVIDFGIAKAAARYTDTQAGVHKGKLAYMAPEQMRGEADLDARVDVWAAGVTLYVALTGHHPFRGANDAATIHRVLESEIAPPSTAGAPPCLDAIVMKALERAPEDRWQSAQAFSDALRAVALEHHLLGSPTEVAAWVSEAFGDDLSKRRRMIHGATATDPMTHTGPVPALPRLWTLTDPMGATPSGGAMLSTPAPKSQPPPSRTERSLRAVWIAAIAIGLAVGAATLLLPSAIEEPAADAAPPTVALEPERPPETAQAQLDTVEPVLAAPDGEEPAESAAEAAALDVAPVAPDAADAIARDRTPSRWRRRPSVSAATVETSPPPVEPAREEAPRVVEEPPPAPRAVEPPPPARPTAPPPHESMESNPYLRGE